jgi:hypothetical protein
VWWSGFNCGQNTIHLGALQKYRFNSTLRRFYDRELV